MLVNPIDKEAFPFVHSGHQYAVDVVSGDIPNCVYVQGACIRYLEDYEKAQIADSPYVFDLERAERYLRLVQKFSHVKGQWETENIVYLPWQNFIFMNIQGFRHRTTGFPRFRTAHIEVSRGQGKALCLETEVPTPDRGMVKFGSLKVGDFLYASDGTVCEITGRNEIHYPKAYRVTFSEGTSVDCSSNHLWVTSDKSERDREKNGEIVGDTNYSSVKTTEEIFKTLKIRGETNHAVGVASPVVGTREDCQLAYILGYWLGYGHSSHGKFTAHVDQFEEIESRFKSQRLDVEVTSTKGKAVQFITRGLTFWLKEIGVLGNKHIPEKYFRASEVVRRELLRGLMDSDGTATKSGNFVFTNTNERLAKGTRRLIASLGYKSSLTVKRTTAQNGFVGQAFNVAFSTPTTRPAVFGIRAKEDRRPTRPVYYCNKRYIVSVEEIPTKAMFCIEVNSKDHTFLITDQYIPTHNSAMASQAALYYLALDNPKGSEISCVATKTDQARIVLDSARAMAKANATFLKKTGVEVLAHKIVHNESNSFVRALSSDDKSLDGLNDVLAICDELHAMSRELFEVVYSGMSKRRDSLLLCITTAGFSTDSIGYTQSVYAKKVAKGEFKDEQFFSMVYTIDEGDDIFCEASWKKANPSYGFSVDPVTLEAKAKKAKETPSDIPNFKVKHLNCWISEANAFFDLNAWDKCASPEIKFEDFKGQKCFVGIDLASKVDLTCIGYIFKKEDKYYLFDRTYIPELAVTQARNALYDECVAKGFLTQTPGEAIHYPMLREDFVATSKKVKIAAALYDPWNAVSFAQECQNDRINMMEYRMNTANLSEATKNFDALIRQGKIVHNGSPMIRWCLGNVVCKEDAAGNVFPRKSNDKLKIDPIISFIMAIAAWTQEDANTSVYEGRGVRTL